MKKASFAFFMIFCISAMIWAGSITVTSPNGGETLVLEKLWTITWTATNVAVNVKIQLIRPGGGLAGLIKTNLAPGNSSFSWTVGQTASGSAPAGSYKVRVVALDNSVLDESDAAFTIVADALPPDNPPAGQPARMVNRPELAAELRLKFPRLEVSRIDLAPNTDGFGIVFNYKNVGQAALPKAADVPVKPSYRVLVDGKETASGSLFIPAFAAQPDWEQVGYFGGWIKLPSLALLAHESMAGTNLYHEDAMVYRWHIGDKITVHINENEVMGMKSHSRSENLEWMAMTEGNMYDLRVHEATYDWNTQVLKIKVVLDGKIPTSQSFTLMCIDPLVPDRNFSIKQAMDKHVFELARKVDLGDFVNFFKFNVFVIGNADNPQKNIGDVDMRNNLYILRIQRPK